MSLNLKYKIPFSFCLLPYIFTLISEPVFSLTTAMWSPDESMTENTLFIS